MYCVYAACFETHTLHICTLLCSQISVHAIPSLPSLFPNSMLIPPFTPCQALVGYFDVIFDVKGYSLSFSTSPQDTPTHWKQTVFHFKDPIPVHTGMHLSHSHIMLSCVGGEKRAVYTLFNHPCTRA